MSAPCPHCGRPNAPVGEGRIDRHRRADHKSGVDPSNQLCLASFTRPAVGEPCNHLAPDPHCAGGFDGRPTEDNTPPARPTKPHSHETRAGVHPPTPDQPEPAQTITDTNTPRP